MDIQVIPYGEWTERWKLLTAAGDQMDVAWIGWMHNYDILAREGQILALDDLIDANASGLREALPAFVLDKAKVDGITYSVPNYQQMTEMRTGIRLYKDIADASVDVAALEAKFTSDLTFDLDDWQAIEPYFAYAKDNGMIAKGASVTLPWVVWNGYEGIGKGVPNVSGPVVKIGDPTCEVLNPFTTSQYQDMITTMADWYAKGYIREDILSVEKPRDEDYKANGTIAWVHESHKGQSEKETKRAADNGNPVEIVNVPTVDFQYIAPYGTPTNLAIPFTAAYPEEAIQLINLLNTDAEFYNLMVHGLEGINYEMVSDGVIKVTDADSYGLANWATGNTLLGYEIEGGVPGWNDYLDEMHKEATTSNLMGFKINTEPYTTELQQIQTVINEYVKGFEYGALGEDGLALYDEFIDKLDKAGMQTVIDGYQEQIDAFLAK